MDWIIPALIGWCGNELRWRWPLPRPGGGGGGWDDPWPPNCPMCGGLIGALSGLLINVLIGPQLAEVDFVGRAIVFFAAGVVGSSLVGGIVGMARSKTRI